MRYATCHMLSIGIVGLPNVGKSTLFQALTQNKVDIADYPFTTIDPNVGTVAVPDERLVKLVEMIKPETHFPSVVEFVDIAGLVKNAHQGEGLGNQFLSHIFAVDAILFLVRCFKGKNSLPDPEDELAILKEEMHKKDEEIDQRGTDTPPLLDKPYFVVGNIKSQGDNLECPDCALKLDAKLELELSEMSQEDIEELGLKSSLPELISRAYQTLDLISFYTIKGGKELRAWPVKESTAVEDAAGIVHTDFKEKFIKAEVIRYDRLLEAGTLAVSAKQSNPWQKAREKGWLQTEGRDYKVKDGDVIEFKI